MNLLNHSNEFVPNHQNKLQIYPKCSYNNQSVENLNNLKIEINDIDLVKMKYEQTRINSSAKCPQIPKPKISQPLKQTFKKTSQKIKNSKQSQIKENQNNHNQFQIYVKQTPLINVKQNRKCLLCEEQINLAEFVKLCNCQHQFCKSCVTLYVTYKIRRLQLIVCPLDNCNIIINQQSQFYQQLSLEIKNIYLKICRFYINSNDPSLKLCPKQKCQGIIKMVSGKPLICNLCNRQLCPICYFEKHQGKCDKNQKIFIQKICKQQLCVCCAQDKKDPNHKCQQIQHDESACNCSSISKLIIQILFAPLILFVLAIFLLMSSIICILMYIIVTLNVGMMGYTGIILAQLYQRDSKLLFVLSLIFIPITILYGLITGFTEYFPQITKQKLTQFYHFFIMAKKQFYG